MTTTTRRTTITTATPTPAPPNNDCPQYISILKLTEIATANGTIADLLNTLGLGIDALVQAIQGRDGIVSVNGTHICINSTAQFVDAVCDELEAIGDNVPIIGPITAFALCLAIEQIAGGIVTDNRG